MSLVWLKYQTDADDPVAMRFDATRDTLETIAKRVMSEGRRGFLYSHTQYKRDSWSLVISPDELFDDAKFAFIVAFWTAHNWWIVFDDSAVEPDAIDFIPVALMSDGRLPVEYMMNHKQFRNVSFDVFAIAPS